MSTLRWTGEAAAVAQLDTFTPANVEADDIFTLTATGQDGRTKAISFTATAATVANVCTGLAAAWNAATDALCTPVTAADNTTTITLTADTAGTAFSVASTTTEGGGNDTQTLTRAATTANSGPNDWSCADNWSGGVVPGGAANQDVYLDDAVIYYGLDQSAIANALDLLDTANAQVGINPADGFLPVYLQIKASAADIGRHIGAGTVTPLTPVNIDFGSTASVITVYNTGTNSDSTQPAVRLLANNAATTVDVKKGKVGIAYHDGETSTFATITVSYNSNVSSDADCYIGEGVTFANLKQKGGECFLRSAIGTAGTLDAGSLVTYGSGAITAITINGGDAELNSTGTITALDALGGIADFTKSSAARTVTTLKIDPGATLKFDPSVVTMTNKIQPYSSSGNITIKAA